MVGKYPLLKGKKIITYAPTFRGRISTHFKEALIDLEKIHQAIGNDYIVIYKSHPLIQHSNYEKNEHVLYIQDELISSTLLCDRYFSDRLFGQFAIDWMVFNKPIIAYSPDLMTYSHKPGFTIDYENEFPGQVTKNEDELIKAIIAVND